MASLREHHKIRLYIQLSSCVLLLSIALLSPATSSAYKTDRVVLVVIDGLRATEGFEERPRDFIPMMWDSLTPRGTLYPNHYNLAATWTAPAHAQMCGGRWEFQPNCGYFSNYPRPEYPTIFEYYRKTMNAGSDDAYIISNKVNIMLLTHSLSPAYGEADSASFVYAYSDQDVYDAAAEIMEGVAPPLVLINFGDVDHYGHQGPWENYTSKIATADTLVYRVWAELIQGNGSPYRDKTTMIVTTDHGRHDNAHGGIVWALDGSEFHAGYRDHNDLCHGCQHLFLLALGPDTPRGAVCDRRADQTAICATIAELLGLDAPYADDTVLWEMIGQETPTPGIVQEEPQLAIADDVFHKVWLEKNPSTGGRRAVYHARSSNGDEWSSPTKITTFVDSACASTEAFFPSLSVDGSNVDIAWSYLVFRDGTGAWEVWHRRSTDGGYQWDRMERLAAFTQMGADTIAARSWPWRPSVIARGDTVAIFYANHRYDIGYCISAEGGAHWPDTPPQYLLPGATWRSFVQHVKAALVGEGLSELHLLWNDIRNGSYNLYHQCAGGNRLTWLPCDEAITMYTEGTHVIDFAIAPDGDALHVLVADNRETVTSTGVLQIYHTCSSDWGGNRTIPWHPVSRTHHQAARPGAIDPSLAVAGHDTLYAAWADHKDGTFEIYTARSTDGGHEWSRARRHTFTPGFSVRPHLTWHGGEHRMYLVYQDNSGGSWQVSDVYDITYGPNPTGD